MKTLSILTLTSALAVIVSAVAQAHTLPDGTLRGDGLWKSKDTQGTYDVITNVAGDKLTSTYTYGTQKREVTLELRDAGNGFLRVFADGRDAGSGYCLEKVVLCHYSVNTAKISLEETLTVQEGKLYKFGSKTEGGVTVMWQEALVK
jgi:hypothetical protein